MGANRNGKRRLLVVAGGVMIVAACGLAIPSGDPRDLPKVEQRWVVTVLETTIDMGDLINRTQASATPRTLDPQAHASVASSAPMQWDSNGVAAACSSSDVDATIAFENDQVIVNDGSATLKCSLRDLCPSCSAGSQSKPALSLSRTEDVPLPGRDDLTVKSVSVTGGSVEVSLEHDFVLLKPGEVEVEVWSSGDGETEQEMLTEFSLDRDLVGGDTVYFTHNFDRNPATIVGGVMLKVDVDSPADPDTTVDIDLSDSMRATISVAGLKVSAVGVTIDKELEPDPQPITVDEDTVSEIADRVSTDVGVTIKLVNPFPIEVQGTFDLGEAVQLTTAQKSITVEPATGEQPAITTKEVALTPEQLRAFLEQGVFSFGGKVFTDGVVTLDTDKEITVTITVDVSLLTEPLDA